MWVSFPNPGSLASVGLKMMEALHAQSASNSVHNAILKRFAEAYTLGRPSLPLCGKRYLHAAAKVDAKQDTRSNGNGEGNKSTDQVGGGSGSPSELSPNGLSIAGMIGGSGFSATKLAHENLLASDAFYFLEQLMGKWRADPKSVHPSWSLYFKNLAEGGNSNRSLESAMDMTMGNIFADESSRKTANLIAMIRAFQKLGHFQADTNPLKFPLQTPFVSKSRVEAASYVGSFTFEHFGFKRDEDWDRLVELNLPNHGGFQGVYGTELNRQSMHLQDTRLSDFVATVPNVLYQKKSTQHTGENEMSSSTHMTIGQVYERLRQIYLGSIGVEFLHMPDRARLNWIRNELETPRPYEYSKKLKRRILQRTIAAVQFDAFLQKKFSTVKRFGLDGCEGAIVSLCTLADLASLMGFESVMIAMAHRGRLNTLSNVMQKPLKEVLTEFLNVRPQPEPQAGGHGGQESHRGKRWGNTGDVKYHMGVEYEYKDPTTGKHMLMSMPCNPSHLEAVDGVLLGNVYARQQMKGDVEKSKVLPVAIHGDAAMAGQGVVYESIQMGDLRGYGVGGTIHVVLNNQIGFTTNPEDAGSGLYCTDVAKTIGAPVLHINADDPEALSFAMELAIRYRQTFKADIFLDIVGYRRYGHNELDMPHFTQPTVYQKIQKHPNVLDIYSKKLVEEKTLSQDEVDKMKKDHMDALNVAYEQAKSHKPSKRLRRYSPQWDAMATPEQICSPRLTGVNEDVLVSLGSELNKLPASFKAHPTVAKIYEAREKCFKTGQGLDFGTAEALAFATMLREGTQIRVSGQDVERGTFSHRHAVVCDQRDGSKYTPLQALADNRNFHQSRFDIHNSLLSECAVLGFEYGFSLENPNYLNIWEAQFGDFCNGAQVVIDQFIASGETKWNQSSGLVMMLPHGYDGQGPEHSSGRLERFLTLCDDRSDVIHEEFWNPDKRSCIQCHNMQVCVPSTSSQMFHLLRRQINRGFRKPLIIMTPKKLLRMREACSPLRDFAEGTRFVRYYFDDSFEPLVAEKSGELPSIKYLNPSQVKSEPQTPNAPPSTASKPNNSNSSEPNAPPPPTSTATASHLRSREKVQRLVLCCGQVYYDLVKARAAAKLEDTVMIARVEQLSPFPIDQLINDLRSLPNLQSVVWCQEEPMNQGAWPYVGLRLRTILHQARVQGWCSIRRALYAGRDVCATTATGSSYTHAAEQKQLLEDALKLDRTTNSYYEKYSEY